MNMFPFLDLAYFVIIKPFSSSSITFEPFTYAFFTAIPSIVLTHLDKMDSISGMDFH